MSSVESTHFPILVLQHPQESRKSISTVHPLSKNLKNLNRVVGLSWRSLKHALEKTGSSKITLLNSIESIQPKNWAVLYLGSKEISKKLGEKTGFFIVKKDKSLTPLTSEIFEKFQGLVVLDGTWPQSKTLWWRNPWLRHLTRVIIQPGKPSLYGALRKEPRHQSLSTLEAVSYFLSLEETCTEIQLNLIQSLKEHISEHMKQL